MLAVIAGIGSMWVLLVLVAVFLPGSLSWETLEGFLVISFLENVTVLVGSLLVGRLAPGRPVLHAEIAFLLAFSPGVLGHVGADDLILWREIFDHGQGFVWAAVGGWLGGGGRRGAPDGAGPRGWATEGRRSTGSLPCGSLPATREGTMSDTESSEAITPDEAVERLMAGNRRWRESAAPRAGQRWNRDLAEVAQHPFAIVIGCADSRVPVELVFDQGFGELFVIRVAGNVIGPSVIGSVEFAASHLGTGLVVVMGHTRCGAVAATIAELETGADPGSESLRSITGRIAPRIESIVRSAGEDADEAAVTRDAVRANASAVAERLVSESPILGELVEANRLRVVAAEYELETGEVHVLS